MAGKAERPRRRLPTLVAWPETVRPGAVRTVRRSSCPSPPAVLCRCPEPEAPVPEGPSMRRSEGGGVSHEFDAPRDCLGAGSVCTAAGAAPMPRVARSGARPPPTSSAPRKGSSNIRERMVGLWGMGGSTWKSAGGVSYRPGWGRFLGWVADGRGDAEVGCLASGDSPNQHGTLRVGFAGIDLAFAKGKRLPVVICTWTDGRLVPEPLKTLPFEPPRGHGNARVFDREVVHGFVDATATYLERVSASLGIRLARIAIDAPSSPRAANTHRRAAEVAMDRAGISCFATPSAEDFDQIELKVHRHLAGGGAENRIPHANQLWMSVGFRLFRRLSHVAPCIEVFPQATARVLGSGDVHKAKSGGVLAQLTRAASHTGWPSDDLNGTPFEEIGFGPAHDRLDAYLSAWVAALDRADRIAFGDPPDDVIWAPRLADPEFTGSVPPNTATRRISPAVRGRKQHPERHKRLCPACGEHEFVRWPFGWDAHAAHRCAGLLATEAADRKAEFKARFGHTFGGRR